MNKELLKSATLTVLIMISLFFTYNMWSLQPSYENFKNTGFFESIPISQEKREFYQVIKPQQLYIHTAEQKHYSSLNDTSLTGLWKEMQEWGYSNQKNLSAYTKEKFHQLIHTKEPKIELRFYDNVPIATFQSMVEWDNATNTNFVFDRIILSVEKGSEIQKVYFVSYDKMNVIETSVNLPEASHFVANIFEQRGNLDPYFSFETELGDEIILPEKPVNLIRYQYFTEEIEGEKLKNALFNNPQIVKQDVNVSKNRYTDGTRELNIFQNQHLVKYVNPTLRDLNSVAANVLIEQSITFLNDHGGWTDEYVLFDVQEEDQEVQFIMSLESIPIINSMENPFGPTMISQRWGKNEIAIYERPLYQLLTPPLSSENVNLLSGRKIVELVNASQQLNQEQLNNIFIAYELGASDNQQTVYISPVWCIEMKDGTLMKMNEVIAQPGGDENGVE